MAPAGLPNHPAGRLFPGYRGRYLCFASSETLDGLRVVRIAHFIRPNHGTLNCIASFPGFALSAALTATFMRPFDAFIGTPPPLLGPFAAWWKTRLPRRPFVLEVRDLWPESGIATVHGDAGSASMQALAGAARFLYRHADRIVTVTPTMRDFLTEHHGVPAGKIDVIMAGVDAEAFKPAPAS
ncbi:MAG: hypothetical protein EXR57_06820 [Dehalococcoidia bacterium]|nr:hypothetical protein [Dehalococcoidia bacterium]